MAIPLIVPLSLMTGIPYNVVRKRKYGLPGEVSVRQTTTTRKDLFINGLKKGDRVIVLDDVVSTGGTLRAIVIALKTIGVDVRDVIVVVKKTDRLDELEREIGQNVRTLVSVKVKDGKVQVI